MSDCSTAELLAPARDLETGLDAISAGADAVYIGGPSFGARSSAGNSLEDIEKLAKRAHVFGAKIHVALNTILTDDELREAEKLANDLYEAGADALIIQDMGLLECSLPPIELHASTQQNNSTPEKVKFLQDLGFAQAVLARELSLAEIRKIHAAAPDIRLEAFVHGALCVGVSGRCYLSAALTGRSANRGECAQLCRVRQSLYTEDGTPLAENRYLLSMRDLNQTKNLGEMLDAGIRSFKIEGRLKDRNYVKNITAWYREHLDAALGGRDIRRESSGKTVLSFRPDPEKSFNRGFTEYNTHGKKEIYANFDAPGFVGERIGTLAGESGNRLRFHLRKGVTLSNGDCLNYYDRKGELTGFRASTASGSEAEVFQDIPRIAPGTVFYRNRDTAFEKELNAPDAAVRKLDLILTYEEFRDHAVLTAEDEDGNRATAVYRPEKPEKSGNRKALEDNLRQKLSRLGQSDYRLTSLNLRLSEHLFIPAGAMNALRREVTEKLTASRMRRTEWSRKEIPGAHVPGDEMNAGYRLNIANRKAEEFYEEHGAESTAPAFEIKKPAPDESVVLVSKHCLKYCFKLCPKYFPETGNHEDLVLVISGRKFSVQTDCGKCVMKLVGPLPQ